MSLILDGTSGLSDVDGTAAAPAIRGTDTNTGIFFPSADTIAFSEGGVESMRIDASGNVGIGTSSPTNFTPFGYGPTVESRGGFGGSFIVSNSDNTVRTALTHTSGATAGYLKTLTNHPLTFGTNDTERARIDSSGNLLVGRTSLLGSAKLQVLTNASSLNAFSFQNSDNAGYGGYFYNASGSPAGSIIWTATSTAYNTSSDYRLKEAIAPMTGALAKVALLKPVTYKWKVDGSDGQGFIAHELAEVEAGCVTGEKDAVDSEGNPQYQGIDTSFLVATLTAAIQEQQTLITALTARITALEAPIV